VVDLSIRKIRSTIEHGKRVGRSKCDSERGLDCGTTGRVSWSVEDVELVEN
jgi:hypothetical protein